MDEIRKAPAPQPPALDTGRWIGQVILAVLVAEGIWGLIVSVTNNVVLPFLAREMGGDPQSPLYLGKGDYSIPAVFASVLQLCLAGLVAVLLSAWVQRRPKPARVKKAVKVTPSIAPPEPSIAATAATQTVSPQTSLPQTLAPQVAPPSPEPVMPKPVSLSKPKKPKEVYYNLVGEPVSPEDDE